MSARQYKKDPNSGKVLLHATGRFKSIVDADGNVVDQEFVADSIVGGEEFAVGDAQISAVPAATIVAASSRYLLNTTKSTYHGVECAEAVSGSLRTLEEIATMNPDAKPCGKCQPPELLQPSTDA